MFQNIGRKLASIARAAIQGTSLVGHDILSHRESTFTGRGKSGKVTRKQGNAAQLKRASTKANNIRKFNS